MNVADADVVRNINITYGQPMLRGGKMNKKKDSNPKEALGVKKVPLHVVPSKPLLEVGLAMMEGGRKYGAHNYRQIGVRMSTYYDAIMRHVVSWWEGEDIDPDSGIHHLVKAMACLFVVRDGMHMGNCIDDRPIQYPDGINMNEFNKLAAELIIKYPECVKPFTWHTGEYNAAEIDGPIPELEAGKPRFIKGDMVCIKLRSDTGDYTRQPVDLSNGTGIYMGPSDTGHEVILAGSFKHYWFYDDELSPMEGGE